MPQQLGEPVEEPVEEYESIPWDALLTDEGVGRRRWVSMAAAGLVALALSAAVARAMWPPAPAPVTPVTEVQAPPPSGSPAPETGAGMAPSTAASSSIPPEPRPPLSEADLLAVDPASLEREAAAVAAWFVHGYFTRDGAADGDGEGGGALSFVEEVAPVGALRLDERRVAVTLLVRSLVGGSDGYRRAAPKTVEVVVDLGGPEPLLLDRPRPVSAPLPRLAEPEVESADPPGEVLEAALGEAGLLGTPRPASIVAGRQADLWRLQLEVEDQAGIVWTIAVWVDGAGRVVPAGG